MVADQPRRNLLRRPVRAHVPAPRAPGRGGGRRCGRSPARPPTGYGPTPPRSPDPTDPRPHPEKSLHARLYTMAYPAPATPSQHKHMIISCDALTAGDRRIQQANPELAGVFGDVNWANKDRLPESALVAL